MGCRVCDEPSCAAVTASTVLVPSVVVEGAARNSPADNYDCTIIRTYTYYSASMNLDYSETCL